jgi:hypothetical protein
MPRRTAKKQAGNDAGGFGAVGGSSQRSIKEVFGAIAGGTSQALRSIKEQFGGSSSEKEDGHDKTWQGKSRPKEKSMKAAEPGSKVSRRSKMDKSHQSKRGLRSGVAASGRVPQARGWKIYTMH